MLDRAGIRQQAIDETKKHRNEEDGLTRKRSVASFASSIKSG